MVVFDATTLLLLLNPNTGAPIDPSTGQPVSRCKDRIEFLLQQLSDAGSKILIPTPALSEALIRAGRAAPQYLDIMRNSRYFQICPFDTRTAVEASVIMADRIAKFGTLRGDGMESKAKIKFDIQIVATAKIMRAMTIYTDDEKLQKLAGGLSLAAEGVGALPLPPEKAQTNLFPDSEEL